MAVWKPRFLTLHASGSREMMEAAQKMAPKETCLLGVTVLTSLSEEAAADIGWADGVQATVERLSALAKSAGLGGIVCSPHEASAERKRWIIGEIVTPGVRPPAPKKGTKVESSRRQKPFRRGLRGLWWVALFCGRVSPRQS